MKRIILPLLILSVLLPAALPIAARASAGATWTQATSGAAFPVRGWASTVVFNNKLWIMGGLGASYYNDVWYSSDGVTWTQATASAPWQTRMGATALVFNNKMWIIGGASSLGAGLADTWYSTDGVNWTEATASTGWGGGHSRGLVFNNQMWVFGDANNLIWSSSDGVTWTQVATFPLVSSHTRAYPGMLVYNNEMWILGGQNASNDVWYSTDGVNWTQATAHAAWPARNGPYATVWDNKMWLTSAYYGSAGVSYNDAWYSTDGVNWTEATASAGWGGGRSANILAVFKNKAWIISGCVDTSCGTVANDVWYSASDIWNP